MRFKRSAWIIGLALSATAPTMAVTVSLTPAVIPEGSLVTSSMTFVVPTGGMTAGGGLRISLPSNWQPSPLQVVNTGSSGYVTAVASGPFSFTITPSTGFAQTASPSVSVILNSGTISAGTPINVSIANMFPGCPNSATPSAIWSVSAATSATASFVAATVPAQSYIPGPASYLQFDPASPILVAAGQPSSALVLRSADSCNTSVAVSSPLTVTLQGYGPNNVDTAASFSAVSNFSSTLTSVVIASGTSSASFFYRTTSTGNALSIRGTYINPAITTAQTVFRSVVAVANAPSFGGVSLDFGNQANVQSTLTLSPDGTANNSSAFVRFAPSDNSLQWHVAISSDGFNSTVFERYGSGNPQGTVSWDGRDWQHAGVVVPNGNYVVRIEYYGFSAAIDQSLTIVVNTAQFAGMVLSGTAPVSGANVSAQNTSGPGYSQTTTDASGHFTLNGVRASSVYNLYASYTSPTSLAVITGQVNSVSAPNTNVNFALSTPGVVRVMAVTTSSRSYTTYGNLNLHTTDYSLNYNASIRLQAGATVTDNGDYFQPSSWTVLYVKPGSYVLHLSMPGYGVSDQTVVANADVVLSIVPKASIYGWVKLPQPVSVPTWIPIQGTRSGASVPTVYGGVSFSAQQSSGIYTMTAVDSGTYVLRASLDGYVPSSLAPITVGTSDIGDAVNGGADFNSFSVGGIISGSLTVSGDTSNQLSPFSLFISAYAPQTNLYIGSQITLSTSITSTQTTYQIRGLPDGTYKLYSPYLQGFESQPVSPPTVTVVNAVGHANLTLVQVSGQLGCSFRLPSGATDYNNVHLSLTGNQSLEADMSGASFTINHLGTGYYVVTATYLTTGAQSTTNFSMTNGQTKSISLDLSAPTYAIAGTVSVRSPFSVQTGTTPAQVSTIGDLLAAATGQSLTFGGSLQFVGNAQSCVGGTTNIVTTARVEAFPKTFNSYNASTTLGNTCFGVGSYRYGTIDASGNYQIDKLTSGVWEIDVYPNFDGSQTPNAAATKQFVTVSGGNVSAINFALTKGNAISGTLALPTGVVDSRSFNVEILSDRGDILQTGSIQVGDTNGTTANTAAFSYPGLPAGSYSLLIQDFGSFDNTLNRNVTKYVATPYSFTIAGADVTNVTIAMARTSRIIGKMAIQGKNSDGTPSLTLVTTNNTSLLPSNFFISASANPWVTGGSAEASFGQDGRIGLDTNNQFTIEGLVTGIYDVRFNQNSFDASSQSAASINLASYTQGSIAVTEGQTTDLGTITLTPGLALSGNVTDTNGVALSNITVRANPSTSNNGDDGTQTTTDTQGNFTLQGLNPALKIYDIDVAPRPGTNDSTPSVPYGEFKKLAVDVTQVPAPTLSFKLQSATAGLRGHVVTADHGALAFPDSDQAGYPAAAIYFHAVGALDADNPLGDESVSDLNGTFALGNLVPGAYDVIIESLGYQPLKIPNVILSANQSKDLGTLTLLNGPALQVALTKPDGSLVSTNDVKQAVAASPDLSSIIFGRIKSDAATNNILSISFAGFQLAPLNYSILLFDNNDNILLPPEGRNLSFSHIDDSVVKAMTYQPSAPTAFTHVLKSGDSVAVTYYFSRPLRNRGDDQNPHFWFTVTNGQGVVSGETVSGDRRQLTVLYTPAAGEQRATLAFNTHTVDLDPSTGVEFVLSKTITLLLGQKATAEGNINPALGGSVSLSDNSDPSNIKIPSNALRTSSGTQADAGGNYSFTFTATDSAGVLAAAPGARAASFGTWLARGASAYVSEAYAGMVAARDAANINPLSSFYSVLLPAGLSHSLNQTGYLTLNYDASADPTLINVYYFDGTKYFLENAGRLVDTVNRTITVGVNHFSTFVVLQNAAPIVQTNGAAGSGPDIDVFNFPNPFNLEPKTETLNRGGTTSSLATDGTIIRYFVPASKLARATLEIYDVRGQKVRTIELGLPTADTYAYVPWDGRNNDGHKVASGLYVGELKVGDEKRFFKMAVIK